tara:strand:- start:1593 stop:2045 length:453 start_codon:yes stop_codon:yes gene_type:complete
MGKMLDEIMEFSSRYGDFPRAHVSKALRMNTDFQEGDIIIKSFRIPKVVTGTKLKQESWTWRCKAYPPDIFEDKESETYGASIFIWREKGEVMKTHKFARKYIVDDKLVTHRELSASYQHPAILKTSFGVNLKIALSDEQHVLIMWVYGK